MFILSFTICQYVCISFYIGPFQTFSCCSCNCCSDGCCTCCVDCDPLICCCLEIRLVSRSESPLKEPNAVKYTVRTQSAQNHNKEPNNIEKSKVDLTKDNKGHEKKINYEKKSVKIPHSSRSDRSDKSVTSPRSLNSGTPRSVSQLQVSCTPSSGKKRRTGKPSSKLKSGTLKPQLDRKLLSGARSLPSPPALPSRSQTSDHVSDDNSGSRERNSSESSAGELVEIPVEQQNVYLQSDLYKNTQLKKNSHLSPDLILGLPLGDHGASDSFPQGASSANVNQSSSVSMRPGTILDGSMSHRDGFRHSRDGSSSYRDGSISYRSVVSGSNISVHFDGQQKAGVMNLTSPRPLPGPPMR